MAVVHHVMHSVSASIEYVCSTTTAANSGPTTSLCTAGNATRPIAATEGASATTAVRTTSVAPGLVISVLRREYSLAWASVLSPDHVARAPLLELRRQDDQHGESGGERDRRGRPRRRPAVDGAHADREQQHTPGDEAEIDAAEDR